MSNKATSKRKNRKLARRKVRHAENTYTDAPFRDKTIGQCSRRQYGCGVASGTLTDDDYTDWYREYFTSTRTSRNDNTGILVFNPDMLVTA